MDFWIASHFPHMAIIHQQFVVLDYVILVHSRPIDTLHDSLLPNASPTSPCWHQIWVWESRDTRLHSWNKYMWYLFHLLWAAPVLMNHVWMQRDVATHVQTGSRSKNPTQFQPIPQTEEIIICVLNVIQWVLLNQRLCCRRNLPPLLSTSLAYRRPAPGPGL